MNEKNRLLKFTSQHRLMFTMVSILHISSYLHYCYAAGSSQMAMTENATCNPQTQSVSLAHARFKREVKKKSWQQRNTTLDAPCFTSPRPACGIVTMLDFSCGLGGLKAVQQLLEMDGWKWYFDVFWTAVSCSERFQGVDRVPRIYGTMQTMGFLSSTCVQHYEVLSMLAIFVTTSLISCLPKKFTTPNRVATATVSNVFKYNKLQSSNRRAVLNTCAVIKKTESPGNK